MGNACPTAPLTCKRTRGEADVVSEDAAWRIDTEQVRLDPAAVFPSPGALLQSAALRAGDKADMLRRWYYDAEELAVAEDEGMPGRVDDGDLMREILLALQQLTAVDLEHAAPSTASQ